MSRDEPNRPGDVLLTDETLRYRDGLVELVRGLDPLEQHRMTPRAYYVAAEQAAEHLANAAGVPIDVVHRGAPLAVDPVGRPTPARVPEWVKDPAKWQTLSRADRRELERYHRKQQRGR